MSDPTSLPSFPPPADSHPLRGRVLDALIDAGGQPDLDSDGDIVVTVNDQTLFVRCVDGELPMMRVFGQWRIGDGVPGDDLVRLRAASDLSTRLNLVKIGVHDDVLFVAVDLLALPDTPLQTVLTSSFGAVLNAVRLWHTEAGGQVPENPEDDSDSGGAAPSDG